MATFFSPYFTLFSTFLRPPFEYLRLIFYSLHSSSSFQNNFFSKRKNPFLSLFCCIVPCYSLYSSFIVAMRVLCVSSSFDEAKGESAYYNTRRLSIDSFFFSCVHACYKCFLACGRIVILFLQERNNETPLTFRP